jgi:hypothetical protein
MIGDIKRRLKLKPHRAGTVLECALLTGLFITASIVVLQLVLRCNSGQCYSLF